jgi:hypothetical protein
MPEFDRPSAIAARTASSRGVRTESEGPDVDGVTVLEGIDLAAVSVGDLVPAVVVAAQGVDLVASPVAR